MRTDEFDDAEVRAAYISLKVLTDARSKTFGNSSGICAQTVGFSWTRNTSSGHAHEREGNVPKFTSKIFEVEQKNRDL